MSQHRTAPGGDELPKEYRLHAVVFRHGDWLIAQCLEHDIAAQARSNAELYYEIKRLLVAHLFRADDVTAEPFPGIPKAPKRFWQMYKAATMKLAPLEDYDFEKTRVRPVVELRAA